MALHTSASLLPFLQAPLGDSGGLDVLAARYGHDAKALDQVGQAAVQHANVIMAHGAFQCIWADTVAYLLLQRPPSCELASPKTTLRLCSSALGHRACCRQA